MLMCEHTHERTTDATPLHFGCGGHFIGIADCHFHLHTHVWDYCISTVGFYRPRKSDEVMNIGSDLFETMVFKQGEDPSPFFTAHYHTESEAMFGHFKQVDDCARLEGIMNT